MINYFDKARDLPHRTFGLGFEIQKPNRRKEPRRPCLIPANYKINRQLYSSFILDINEAGAFIETDRSFPVRDKIVLRFIDPYSRRNSLINGSIAWSSDAAIGVKFNYYLFAPF